MSSQSSPIVQRIWNFCHALHMMVFPTVTTWRN